MLISYEAILVVESESCEQVSAIVVDVANHKGGACVFGVRFWAMWVDDIRNEHS